MSGRTAQQVFDRLIAYISELLKDTQEDEVAIMLVDSLLKLELWTDEIGLSKGTLEIMRHDEGDLNGIVVMVLSRLEKKIGQFM